MNQCHTCNRTWTASGQAHCKGGPRDKGCHEHFNSTAAFDKHRKDFECVPLAEFATLNKKTGLPLLVKTMRADGEVWVTALREDR